MHDEVLAGRQYEYADNLAVLKQQANYGANSSHPLVAKMSAECTAIFLKRGFDTSVELLRHFNVSHHHHHEHHRRR